MLKTILLIGDDFEILLLIKIDLEPIVDWKIFIANSICEAVLKAQTKCPDVILLDINSPQTNMIKVIFILHKNYITKHIPIILLTDRPWEINNQGCIHLGIKGIVPKPFERLALVDQVMRTTS